MKLIFIHGVATRSSENYLHEEARRDRFFRDIVFKGYDVSIDNPKWGDLIPEPAWKGLSLPMNSPRAQAFGLAEFLGDVEDGADGNELVSIAQEDLAAAVDSIAIAMLDLAEAENRVLSDEEFQQFSDFADLLAETNTPDWVNSEMTDESFADALAENMSESSSFGLGSAFGDAVSWVTNRSRNLAGRALTAGFRDEVSPMVGKFLGDVFIYLNTGDIRNKIRKRIIDAIVDAHAQKAPDEPLIIVGHSMGGVIAVDLLSDPDLDYLDGVEVDLLATVGSQPGHFEEHKLFAKSDRKIGKNKTVDLVPRPFRVKRWWNVFDPIDPLSFRCEAIFDSVRDFEFSSSVGLLDAHTAYFKRPKFFERFRNRLKAESLLK